MPSQQQVVAGSPTRWCPTPEQLTILEEMYRGGLRTPKSWQIQQITAHLACYGRIERKNVFYWFQNHKARDRMKLRRRLCMSHYLLSWAQYYAAAAAHHGAHGHHHAGFLAATPTVATYGHQLLSPSSTSPANPSAAAAATAAAAAAYGYGVPPPASRCAGNATPPSSPTTTQMFHYQGSEGGGLVSSEAVARPEYSSLGKLEDNFGVTIDDIVVSSAASSADDITPPAFEVAPAPAPPATFCRPLKTLDLFPGGLKEEQHDVDVA